MQNSKVANELQFKLRVRNVCRKVLFSLCNCGQLFDARISNIYSDVLEFASKATHSHCVGPVMDGTDNPKKTKS